MNKLQIFELERIDISDMTMLQVYKEFEKISQRNMDLKVIKGRIYLVSKLTIYKEA